MKIVFSDLVFSSIPTGTKSAMDNRSAGFPVLFQDYSLERVWGGRALDWQTIALVVPREEGRGICDGCVDSLVLLLQFSLGWIQTVRLKESPLCIIHQILSLSLPAAVWQPRASIVEGDALMELITTR